MLSRIAYTALSTFLLSYLITACSITTAPTDASSLTTEQTTDASSDLTSKISEDDDDEAVNVREKDIEQFVSDNFSRLRADMSVGQGEHLTTLALLMSVAETDKEKFYTLCQNKFSSIFPSPKISGKEVVANLRQELVGENS
jgi:hypothetical protein